MTCFHIARHHIGTDGGRPSVPFAPDERMERRQWHRWSCFNEALSVNTAYNVPRTVANRWPLCLTRRDNDNHVIGHRAQRRQAISNELLRESVRFYSAVFVMFCLLRLKACAEIIVVMLRFALMFPTAIGIMGDNWFPSKCERLWYDNKHCCYEHSFILDIRSGYL